MTNPSVAVVDNNLHPQKTKTNTPSILSDALLSLIPNDCNRSKLDELPLA